MSEDIHLLMAANDSDESVTGASRSRREPHPICTILRDLRHAAGHSLSKIEADSGIRSVVIGAYERGDREPPLKKLDALLHVYGYRLAAVAETEHPVVRTPADIASVLHSIAGQLGRAA